MNERTSFQASDATRESIGGLQVARVRRSDQPVAVASRWQSVTVSPYLYAALALLLFLGTVQAASFAGLWTTSGKVTATGDKIVATGQDPAEIKGWMTIDEVTTAYGVTTEDLYARFAIPSRTPSTSQLKELEAIAPDFSVEDLRAWLTELGGG